MIQILQGWKQVLKSYRHWKMILKYPYDTFDSTVFFDNLAQPPNSLENWIKEMKDLDPGALPGYCTKSSKVLCFYHFTYRIF